MDHDSLMGIALYVWEVRQAARAKALGRKALEKAILELGTLREKYSLSQQPFWHLGRLFTLSLAGLCSGI